MVFCKKYRFSIATILLPAICFLMWNSIANLHTHHLSNGVIISHAHPYKKLPDNQQHSHNNQEIFFLQQITTFLFCFLSVVIAIVVPLTKENVFEQLVLPRYVQITWFLYPNRAPPVQLSISN